ncbi:MAG TPA: hypothetical protein VGH26_01860 [Gaiellaceae bacterium]|jgi:hypothetical protein
MTIVNRRNAVIGWVMLKVWKRNARRKAQRARGQVGARRRKTD